MNTKFFAVIFVFFTNFRVCQSRNYDHYVLYHTVPLEKEHLKFLHNLETQKYIEIKFLKKPYKLYEDVHLVIAPKDNEIFIERCQHFGLKVKKRHGNVQDLFDAQKIVRRYLQSQTNSYTWNQYHNLDDINQWLVDISRKYPDVCEIHTIGKSVQNRSIYGLSIVRNNTKGTAFVEGGMHGNEWVSTEFVTFLIQSLLHFGNRSDERLFDVAKNYQWFLVPVVNPDGFVYSHVTDRLWRKNMRSYDNKTYGVDLNRNFDYGFCKFGASNNTADDVYCGPKAFSEPETMALSKFILDNSRNLRYYFSIHAYGQKIIIPYGDKILHVGNYADSENYGKQAIVKMYKLNKVKYSIGNSYDTLGHKISGNSASWVKETFNVPFVYTFLLRDTGKYGYGMPPSEITPTCEETLTAILEIMTTHVKKLRADIFSDSAAVDEASCGLVLSIVGFWLANKWVWT